jgi:hypothetical protein
MGSSVLRICERCGDTMRVKPSRPRIYCSLVCRSDFDAKWMPEPNSGCWLWLNALNPEGYGVVGSEGKVWLAHRYSYVRAGKTIPEGLQLDHLCRVRSCVNPDHLEPVTNKENNERTQRILRSKARTHCSQGHLLSEDNIYWRGEYRQCRRCVLTAQRRLREERRYEHV